MGSSSRARELLRRYTLREAASLAGALCLVPENLNSLARLETLGLCCLAHLPQGGQKTNRTNARNLLEQFRLWAGSMDDPSGCPATQGFTFHGGTYVFVAPTSESMYSLEILRAMSFPSSSQDAAVRRRLHGLLMFGCRVTERCTSAAGLTRNRPMPTSVPAMAVPPTDDLRRLQDAVTFSIQDWIRLLREAQIAPDDARALCAQPAPATIPEDVFFSPQLGQTPFLKLDDSVVLVAPHRLADALTNRARFLISTTEAARDLSREFHERALIRVTDALGKLGFNSMFSDWRPAIQEETRLSDILLGWDDNRRAYVALVSDGCTGARWETGAVDGAIKSGRQLFANLFDGVPPTSVENFGLLIAIPVAGGHELNISYQHLPQSSVVLTAADLEFLARGVEYDERKGLLGRFARARQLFEENGRILAACHLDTIEAWRGDAYRFQKEASMLAVQCDMARPLRERALHQVDAHSVPTLDGSSLIEVQRAEDETLPLYAPLVPDAKAPRLVVELNHHHIWLTLSLASEGVDFRWALEFLRMTGFWLCRFGEILALRAPREHGSLVELRVEATGAAIGTVGYSLLPIESGVRVTVSQSFGERYGSDNEVERQYVTELIGALANAWDAPMSSRELESVVGEIAPLGPMRMLHAFPAEKVPEFAFKHVLPEPLVVHAADLAEVTAAALSSVTATRTGADDVQSVLNGAVGKLYQMILDKVREYDAAQLRTRLMLNNEALVAAVVSEDVTLASQLACAGNADALRTRILIDSRRRSAAAIATRFLLELTTACPGSGVEHVGEVDLQRLLAMASELITLGLSSDVLECGLDQVALEVDDYGYPTVRQDDYDGVSTSTYNATFSERLKQEGKRASVPRSLGGTFRGLPSDEVALFADGMIAEYGLSFVEFQRVLGSLLSLGIEKGPVVLVSHDELVTRVARDAGITEIAVSRFLQNITLEPRKEFLKPPTPFTSSDVYPWRFNRRLSLLYRPLLRTGDEITFTPGHTYRACLYLLDLVGSGRFKASSDGMKRAMGHLSTRAGEEFNDEVARLIEELGYRCRSRVKKFQGLRPSVDGSDLGDIDVLAIDAEARTVFAIECKNLEHDRTPHEVRSDLEDLFLGREGRVSVQEKHRRRVEWLSTNANHVLAELQLSGTGWRFTPLMVLSREHRAPLLGHARMPVISFATLRTERRLPMP